MLVPNPLHDLVLFAIKARLNFHPTNFTIHLWNREHNPLCPFCRQHTESMEHLLNGCREFHNYYNHRHNRIAEKIADEIKHSCPRSRIYWNKLLETVFLEFHDQLVLFLHSKPAILVIDLVLKSCIVVEVTVCFDSRLSNLFGWLIVHIYWHCMLDSILYSSGACLRILWISEQNCWGVRVERILLLLLLIMILLLLLTFQRMMEGLLQGIPQVRVILYNVLIVGTTNEERLSTLDKVLKRFFLMQDYGLKQINSNLWNRHWNTLDIEWIKRGCIQS